MRHCRVAHLGSVAARQAEEAVSLRAELPAMARLRAALPVAAVS